MFKRFFFGRNLKLFRAFLFAALGTSIGILTLYFAQRPSWIFFDFAQKMTAPEIQNAVGLVVVDQKSLDRLEAEGVVFPLPRQVYGAVTEVAKFSNAKAVVFDILFTEPSSYGTEDDALFAELMKKSGLPIFFPAASFDGSVKEPIAILKAQAKSLGGVNLWAEADGIFRKVPDYLPFGDRQIFSLPQAVYLALGGNAEKENDSLQTSYAERGFPKISLYDVLKVYRDLQDKKVPSIDLSHLKNKTWIIGYTAPGLHDLKPMPLNHEASGMLLHATGIANRFNGQGLYEVKNPEHFGLIILVVFFAVYLMNKASDPIIATFWLAGLAGFFPLACLILFWKYGGWYNPLPAFASILVAGGSQLVWNFQMTWKERMKLAKSLQHSMSPEMLDLIRTGEVQITRFGEEREITVLFSDLAGFTTLSEKSTPVEMVRVLNAYLDDVVGLIMSNSGYIDKFIGDAVMVLWGAPVKQENQSHLAFQTAIKFKEICEIFNQKMLEQNPDFEKLITRVGLHTGRAIVGNIGAKQRHNYTAIGDCVNLASRIEGIGKNYHVELTLTEDVVRAANAWNHPGLLELDQIIVKGKTEPTRIYTVVNPEFAEDMKNYRKGLNLYYKADWSEAIKHFREAPVVSASELMIKRCELALSKGELLNWHKGAWLYDSK